MKQYKTHKNTNNSIDNKRVNNKSGSSNCATWWGHERMRKF